VNIIWSLCFVFLQFKQLVQHFRMRKKRNVRIVGFSPYFSAKICCLHTKMLSASGGSDPLTRGFAHWGHSPQTSIIGSRRYDSSLRGHARMKLRTCRNDLSYINAPYCAQQLPRFLIFIEKNPL